MESIYWNDNDGFATLYINKKRYATIRPRKKPGSEPEQMQYLLDAGIELTHYWNHDLQVESLEQAKNAAVMLVLQEMKHYHAEYSKKEEDLGSAIRAMNKTARFISSDIAFEDIDVDTDGKGLSCQITGPIMGKLDDVFGLNAQEGVWYNLYACYNLLTEDVRLVCTINDDTGSTEQEVETTQHERAMLLTRMQGYIRQETGRTLYGYLAEILKSQITADSKAAGDYAIYQLDDQYTLAASRIFMPYNADRLNLSLYKKVYSGNCSEMLTQSCDQILEGLYKTFNIEHPKDYAARSLSVSDLIVLNDRETAHCYYCDNIGFKKVF